MALCIESWIARLLFATISLTAFIYGEFFSYPKLGPVRSDALAAVLLIFSRFLYLPPMPPGQTEAYLYCTFLCMGGIYCILIACMGYVSV